MVGILILSLSEGLFEGRAVSFRGRATLHYHCFSNPFINPSGFVHMLHRKHIVCRRVKKVSRTAETYFGDSQGHVLDTKYTADVFSTLFFGLCERWLEKNKLKTNGGLMVIHFGKTKKSP